MKIQVYGAGCPKCKQTEKIFRIAADELGIRAEFEKVTDLMAIMEKGIASTPAIGINEKIVITGKVPTLEEAKAIIEKYKGE